MKEAPSEHYLQRELHELVHEDPSVFQFLQSATLDGLWYWDLEHLENEWMSPSFWELLGFAPDDKQHRASEWQDLINHDDLEVALENFRRHCEDPDHPYDQVVRYRHKNGSTIWVRCRGIAIRSKLGKPIRLLGAHTDLTALKRTEERLEQKTVELEQTNRDLELALENLTKLSDLSHFSGRLIKGQEAERRRIGRDLHDDLGQRMALLSIHLDRLAVEHPELGQAVVELQSEVGNVSSRIQRIAYDLHPSRLGKLGLALTLEALCRDLNDQPAEFHVSCTVSPVPKQIPEDVSLCIFRVAQEALHNAMHHSGAKGAVVALDSVPGRVRLIVRDEGRGIQLPRTDTGGLGLISMRERVRLIGGTFSIRSAPGQGTLVTAEVPSGPN